MNIIEEISNELNKSISIGYDDRENIIYRILKENPKVCVEDLQNLKKIICLAKRGQDLPFVDIGLVKFMSSLFGDIEGKDILIPWADFGILPKYLVENFKIKSIDICSINDSHVSYLQQLIAGYGKVIAGNAFIILSDFEKEYDLIMGILPFNSVTNFEYKSLRKRYEDVLIAACIDNLKVNGKAAFIVSPSFFRKDDNSLFHNLKEFDIHLEAVIDLPFGTFIPLTSISSHLIVLSKGYNDAVFLAEYNEKEQDSEQKIIARNFLEAKNGKTINYGIWHSHADFKTFSELEYEQRLSFCSSRSGLEKIKFNDLIIDICTINSIDIEKFHNDNCVYFSQIINKEVFNDIQDLKVSKTSAYLRVEIDGSKISSEFLVDYFNNYQLGKMIKNSFYKGITIKKLNIQSVKNVNLYLPNRATQIKIGHVCTKLKSLKLELNELQNKIWNNPNNITKFSKELELINKDTDLNSWIDSLPFPLASILWLYYSDKTSDEKTCYERLLHYFEALCQFMTVIHLSIYDSNPVLWSAISEPLKQELHDNKFNLEIATFGTWLTILEKLVKQSRKLLNDKETEDLICRSYCTEDKGFLDELLGKKIISVLKETIKIRNSYSGHGGIINAKTATDIHDKLKHKLFDLRDSMSVIWDNYRLVIPENSKFDSNYFLYNVRNLTGSKTPFGRVEIPSNKPMQDGKLHLYSNETYNPIELLPFIKVVPSPKTELDACYFYNRMEKQGDVKLPRFVSYHFAADSEQFLPSEGIVQFINKIRE